MNTDNTINMQIAVCKAPDGSGLRVEHISDFLCDETFDDCSPHLHYFYEILCIINSLKQESNETDKIN